jgi:translation initiation factor 2 beta subunit (eIF-2beta)/eIF-5
MASINITGSTEVNDASYRYTMPPFDVGYEGRGNGCKTVIKNLVSICNAIETPETFVVKFFSYELSTQTRYDAELDRFILNGTYAADVLQQTLNKYIDLYVLCSKCHLPEFVITVKKDDLRYKCKSCGCSGVNTADHKLTTYIIRWVHAQKDAKKKA